MPAAGTELAVKAKKRSRAAGPAQAQRRHYYLPRVSKKHPLRNRVILLLRILPICSCWPGVRNISFPRHWARRIADAGATSLRTNLSPRSIVRSVAMWSSSRPPLRALRVGVLSPPCESSDRQFTRIIHVRLFSIARPGKCLPHIVLQPGFLSHLPLDSRPRPRQGLKACQVPVNIVAGTYLTRLLCFAFAWPDAVMTACCCCLCFRTSA